MSARIRGRVLGGVLVAGLLAPAGASAADSVYWGNTGAPTTISWAALDASVGGNLAATAKAPTGLAIDAAAGRMYYAQGDANKISFMGLDGTGGGELPTTGATVSSPTGVAIDPAGGRVYWANYAANKISFANLSGTGGGDLPTTSATVNHPNAVAVDPAGGRVFWTNAAGNKISFARLDGSGGGDLVTTGATVNLPTGIAVDPASGRAYWTNFGGGKISWARIDGTGGGDLNTAGAPISGPQGIAIDVDAGRVIWANALSSKLGFARVDGTGGGTVATLAASISVPMYPVLLKRPAGVSAPILTVGAGAASPLSCSAGTWSPDVLPAFLYRAPRTLGYAWTRNGDQVAGATAKTLVPTQTGTYRCVVTATNAAGATAQTSAPEAVQVAAAPPATPGSPTTPTAPSTGPAGAQMTVGTVRGRRLTVSVTSPGSVRVTGPPSLLRPSGASGPAGPISVALRLTSKGARTLRRHHALRLAVTVRFTPVGGTALLQRRTLVLHQR